MKTRLITAVLVLMAGLLVLAAQCTNENVRPVALFTVDRVDGPSPLTVNFDGSGSYDPDGTIESYSWDFGDGTSGTGITTTHTFSSSTDRTFSVKLTVTDNGGRTHSMSGFVVVYGSGSGAVLFFDDFEDGADPEWVSTDGDWVASEGIFKFYSGSFMPDLGKSFVLAGKNWSSYSIEADVHLDYGGSGRSVGFILYAQEDLSSMVIVWGNTEEIWWQVISNGETVYQSASVSPGLFLGEQHIRVQASTASCAFIVAGLTRSTFENTYFDVGMPGVAGNNKTVLIWPCLSVDNYKVFSD